MPYEPEPTPEQRRREIASILARGLLRLRRDPPESAACNAAEPRQKALEVCAPARPHGTAG